MGNAMVKIDVHLIFHIKSTSVPMLPDDLPRIFAYLGGILRDLGCVPIIVGGITDHIHILTTLSKTKSLSEIMRIIKSKSSKWIKTINPYYNRFAWQNGYGAFSVSPSIVDKTIAYIQNQVNHHRRTSFQDEYKAFLEAYRIPFDEKYLFND